MEAVGAQREANHSSAMDLRTVLAAIYNHLEANNVEGATMACLRVARMSQDYLNAVIFLRELFPKKEEVGRMLYDDANHLKPEALDFIWKRSLDHWLEIHTMDYEFPSDDDDYQRSEGDRRTVLKVAAGEIDAEIKQWEQTVADIAPPSGMTPFDTAAFAASVSRQRAEIRLRLTALHSIKSRLKTRCLNYAIQIEKQLSLQEKNQSVLWSVQNEVNNFFKARAEDVFQKLQKASQLAVAVQGEDVALLLTEVRRALKGAADHFYPPQSGIVTCSDGKERPLGDEQYLNRLEEYLSAKLPASTAKELASAELKLLATFMRRLNDLASKGVHADVTHAEARQGLVGLYLFLSTIIRHLTHVAA